MTKKTSMKQVVVFLGILSVIFIFQGCIPYYKLTKTEFPQGRDLELRQIAVANEYLRSSRIYDKYSTMAIFDALWLSDNVRDAYVNLSSQKSGKSQTAKEALLNRQLEENKHWISFYVLAEIRNQANEMMNENNPHWSVYLDLGQDKKVEPEKIKEIDLDPEYQFIFGDKFNSFKTVYLVQFPILDAEGKNYLESCTNLKLVVSSVEKYCELVWNLEDIQKSLSKISKSKKKVKKDEDYYWG